VKAYPLIICVILLPFLYSCLGTRNAIYFNVMKDSVTQIQYQSPEAIIQKNDLLHIAVSSRSSEESKMYNMPSPGNGASNSVLGGYLVGEDGNIAFPILGAIKAEGLTKSKLQDSITAMFIERKLLLDPIVSVRNLNYKITVLGEVLRPGVINVPSEKINLLEALGFAGDLTIYANRKNVLLIREENNQRIFKILNLNSNDIFSSPYFYLKPNDVIYIEPNRAKISSASTARQWLPVVLSALSLALLVMYRYR
jgi:polysaccharide biosynthesis/export protein